MNETEFADALYRAYESGYENPRSMHYREIESEFGVEGFPEIDAVADAFDLGCTHGEREDDIKFDKQKLLEEMASWGE